MDALCGRPGMRDEKAGTPEPKQSRTEYRVHGERDVALGAYQGLSAGMERLTAIA